MPIGANTQRGVLGFCNQQMAGGTGGTGGTGNTGTAANINVTYGGFVGGMQSPSGTLWGPERDLDFWTAREKGVVPEPELRAMKLLASMCDEKRFAFYCHEGFIAALGNVTKHLYLVRRYARVQETMDGRVLNEWCVMTRDQHQIPETDVVLALKSLIEGEEIFFRETGNRFAWGVNQKQSDPYRMSFIEPKARIVENESIADFESIPQGMKSMKWQMWFRYHAMVEQSRFKMPMEQYRKKPKQVDIPDGLDQMIREELRVQGMAVQIPHQQLTYAY